MAETVIEEGRAGVCTLVQACFVQSAQLFPEIRWELDEFAATWQKHHACSAETAPSIDDYVRLACLERRPGAEAALDRGYIQPLTASVARICRTPEATDSALQKLREKLLLPPAARLEAYRGPGNFRAWLQVTATRTAIDVARALGVQRAREVELDERLEALAVGPEEQFLRAEQQEVFRAALRAAVKRLPERERSALRLHLVAGWNISQIGRVFSVHKATAARWLVAAKEELQTLLQAELATRLGTGTNPGLRILGNMPSRLDLGLSSVFATTGVDAILADRFSG